MNRMTKLICWLAIAETAAAGIVGVAARWPDIVRDPHATGLLTWRMAFALVFLPGWAAYGVVRTERRLRPDGMVLSAGYRRVAETAIVAACLLIAGMETWFAAIFAARHALWNVSPQAVGLLMCGALIAAIGNASAKAGPPTGPAAPEPGSWIRTSLRNGWAVVLSGIVLMAAAFAPVGVRSIVVLAILPVIIAVSISQRRLLRGGTGPQAPA